MAHVIPTYKPGKAEHDISTGVIRSIFQELLTLHFDEFLQGTLGSLHNISRGAVLMSIFAGLLGILWTQIPELPLFAFAWIVGTMPIWVPATAVGGAWKAWVWYNRSRFIATRKPVLLEVKMPRELVRSPRAMEVALAHLWASQGTTTYFHRIWLGQCYPFFSLEMASFGGEVHFYVWTWEIQRRVVEATLYAQYPEIELVETEDYAAKFKYDRKKHAGYCTEWRYEPRNDAYPIKTYVDFELEKDPKEEYKIDPLAQVLEYIGSIKSDEQIWIQIIISYCADKRRKPGGRWFETESRYEGIMKDETIKIRKEGVGETEGEENQWKRYVRIQYYKQTEQIRSIERNMSKHPFKVGMRGVYMSTVKGWNPSTYYPMRWIWRPFGNVQWMNQLRPRRWHNPFDYPYQDWRDMRWDLHTERALDAYQRRAFFHAPYLHPYNMMSTEVIATLWHPPSSGIKTPGLERTPAKKAQPPPNLPK